VWHRIARFPPQYGFWHSAAAEDFDSLAAEHRGLGQPGVDLSGSPQLCKKFFFHIKSRDVMNVINSIIDKPKQPLFRSGYLGK